jgi:steroid delta-isomerase-like uncharacterized protein
MLYEDVKALAHRINDAYNRHDLAAMAALHAPDFKIHSTTIPGGVADFQTWSAVMTMFWNAFPDLNNAVQDMIIAGDTVVLRLNYTATHLGEFMGVPPSGKTSTSLVGIDISRYENGVVKEEWLEMNMLVMLQELGVIPAPAGA